MPQYTTLISNVCAFLIATLYTFAGQAHFTALLTPSFAEHIEEMTQNSYVSFGLPMDYYTFKYVFGALDLLAAGLLVRAKTRKLGLGLSIIGFSGGVYGQVRSGDDLTQVGGLLGIAVLGLVLAPRQR